MQRQSQSLPRPSGSQAQRTAAAADSRRRLSFQPPTAEDEEADEAASLESLQQRLAMLTALRDALAAQAEEANTTATAAPASPPPRQQRPHDATAATASPASGHPVQKSHSAATASAGPKSSQAPQQSPARPSSRPAAARSPTSSTPPNANQSRTSAAAATPSASAPRAPSAAASAARPQSSTPAGVSAKSTPAASAKQETGPRQSDGRQATEQSLVRYQPQPSTDQPDAEEETAIDWDTLALFHNMSDEEVSRLPPDIQPNVVQMREKTRALIEQQTRLENLRSQLSLLQQLRDVHGDGQGPSQSQAQGEDSSALALLPSQSSAAAAAPASRSQSSALALPTDSTPGEEGYDFTDVDAVSTVLNALLEHPSMAGMADHDEVVYLRKQLEELQALRDEVQGAREMQALAASNTGPQSQPTLEAEDDDQAVQALLEERNRLQARVQAMQSQYDAATSEHRRLLSMQQALEALRRQSGAAENDDDDDDEGYENEENQQQDAEQASRTGADQREDGRHQTGLEQGSNQEDDIDFNLLEQRLRQLYEDGQVNDEETDDFDSGASRGRQGTAAAAAAPARSAASRGPAAAAGQGATAAGDSYQQRLAAMLSTVMQQNERLSDIAQAAEDPEAIQTQPTGDEALREELERKLAELKVLREAALSLEQALAEATHDGDGDEDEDDGPGGQEPEGNDDDDDGEGQAEARPAGNARSRRNLEEEVENGPRSADPTRARSMGQQTLGSQAHQQNGPQLPARPSVPPRPAQYRADSESHRWTGVSRPAPPPPSYPAPLPPRDSHGRPAAVGARNTNTSDSATQHDEDELGEGEAMSLMGQFQSMLERLQELRDIQTRSQSALSTERQQHTAFNASVDENDPEQAAADMMQMDAGVERMDADVQRWEDDDEAQDLGMEFPITDGNTTVAEVTNLERDAVLRNLGQGRDYLLPGRISPRSGSMSLAPMASVTMGSQPGQDWGYAGDPDLTQVDEVLDLEDPTATVTDAVQRLMPGLGLPRTTAGTAPPLGLNSQRPAAVAPTTVASVDVERGAFAVVSPERSLQEDQGLADLAEEDAQLDLGSAANAGALGTSAVGGGAVGGGGLLVDLQRARQRAQILQDRLQTARTFGRLSSLGLGDDADTMAALPDQDLFTAAGSAAYFDSQRPGFGSLGVRERAAERRSEEQHQLNLALQYAQTLSSAERQEFLSLFFSRLRENPSDAFPTAAQSYSLILAGLVEGTEATDPEVDADRLAHEDADDMDALTRPARSQASLQRRYRMVAGRAVVEAQHSAPQNQPVVWDEADEGEVSARFGQVRDSIYSEVANFIAGNEQQPHFLLRVFRLLNGMKNDYMRQRTLLLLEDLCASTLSDSQPSAGGPSSRSHVVTAANSTAQQQRRLLLELLRTARSGEEAAASESGHSHGSRDISERLLAQLERDLQLSRGAENQPAALRERQSKARSTFAAAARAEAAAAAAAPSSTAFIGRRVAGQGRAFRAGMAGDDGDEGATDIIQERLHVQALLEELGMSQAEAQDGAETDAYVLPQSVLESQLDTNQSLLTRVQRLLASADPQAYMSPDRIDDLGQIIVRSIQAASPGQSDDDGSDAMAGDENIVAVTVRGILEKYAGELLKDCSDAFMADLEKFLYDETIFARVITQVDESYAEEIGELKKAQESLREEEKALAQQRAKDLQKLQDERSQRFAMVLRSYVGLRQSGTQSGDDEEDAGLKLIVKPDENGVSTGANGRAPGAGPRFNANGRSPSGASGAGSRQEREGGSAALNNTHETSTRSLQLTNAELGEESGGEEEADEDENPVDEEEAEAAERNKRSASASARQERGASQPALEADEAALVAFLRQSVAADQAEALEALDRMAQQVRENRAEKSADNDDDHHPADQAVPPDSFAAAARRGASRE